MIFYFRPTSTRLLQIPEPTLTAALEHARTFAGTRNADWQPFVTPFPDLKIPDMPFCLVPAGTFQMGGDLFEDEKPSHTQKIDTPYWIAQTPVTNQQWQQGVAAGAVPEPLETSHDNLLWYNDPAMADAPVVGVTWFMARDFAAWLGLGARLPTEREWEFAARGVESLDYPWGNQFEGDRLVWYDNSDHKPASVASKPEGKSWVDARHMAGNVWEWTASHDEAYPYRADGTREHDAGERSNPWYIQRGASCWFSRSIVLRAAFRTRDLPDEVGNDLGFRVVRSL